MASGEVSSVHEDFAQRSRFRHVVYFFGVEFEGDNSADVVMMFLEEVGA